jgi:iron complex transport system substrate-binding protein
VSNTRDVSGVLASIRGIGDAVGEPGAANSVVASLRERLDAVTRAVDGQTAPKVFIIVGSEPLITTGHGTFVDDLIRRAGAVSITGDEATEWPQISAETVIARAPEVFVIPQSTHGISEENGGIPASLRETPAARLNRVVRIDGDLLMRPGPRLVDGLEQLARALHPEVFH